MTLLLQGFSYFPVSLYIASYTRTLSTPLTATVILSIFNSSAVAGQIMLGHLSDRFPYPWVMFFSAIGSGVAAFLLWGLASAVTQLYFFAILFGALVSTSPFRSLSSFPLPLPFRSAQCTCTPILPAAAAPRRSLPPRADSHLGMEGGTLGTEQMKYHEEKGEEGLLWAGW